MRVEIEYIPLIPLRELVAFPGVGFPFVVGREKSLRALKKAFDSDGLIFLSTQRDENIDEPQLGDIFTTGTLAEIKQSLSTPGKNVKVIVEGIIRGRIVEFVFTNPYFLVGIKRISEPTVNPKDISSLLSKVRDMFENYASTMQERKGLVIPSFRIMEPGKFADFVAAYLKIPVMEKQNLLEIINPVERLNYLSYLLERELRRTKRGGRRTQPPPPEPGNEVEELKYKISISDMPDHVKEKALREVEKFEHMPPMSAELAVTRNYIEWLVAMPWKKKSRENRNIKKAWKILDGDHYGLKKPKQRIIEYLAIRSLVKKPKGAILCLVGPPGVGKSSIAKSIARATGRKFVRVSLGGVRDEAEIRGHRRTYVGAYPGRIIQGLRKAGVKNPVFLLDEIDKMSADFRGDPAAALMEVLDPEHNSTFLDHYLDVEFDLSEVMFITTANYMEGIPRPLLDRMEIIEIPGYTEMEKFYIAKDYLVPKQIKAHGISDRNVIFTRDAIYYLIRHYTREAGVRELEREIGNICRKVARKVLEEGKNFQEVLDIEKVKDYLGPEKYHRMKVTDKKEVGSATGLAWTEYGGDILLIETALSKGKGELILTGRLGEIMKESAQIAFTYVKTKLSSLSIDTSRFASFDIHVHVPEGAVPKEGPSAGITLATAILSLLTGIPARLDVAMTGEVTVKGRVLKIGGIKEKLLAAYQAGIREVIIPKENEPELVELPDEVIKELKIHTVSNMDEVIKKVLIGDLDKIELRSDLPLSAN
ncbi:MAG: endopeptidase La [Candidatus Aminicenantes bacterium]|nr:endopeptidase La [Candidatus Aminicenantes bacterium]